MAAFRKQEPVVQTVCNKSCVRKDLRCQVSLHYSRFQVRSIKSRQRRWQCRKLCVYPIKEQAFALPNHVFSLILPIC